MNTTKSVLGRTLQQLYEAYASEVCYSYHLFESYKMHNTDSKASKRF